MYFPAKGARRLHSPGNTGQALGNTRSGARRPRRRLATRLLLCLLLSLLASAGASPQTPPAADSTLLTTPGKAIAKEIQGGGSQRFEVPLQAGRYLRLSLSKGDLNLSLKVYGPRGEPLAAQSSRRYETLRSSLVTELDGVYIAEVTSLESAEAARRYELRVEEQRAATARDFKDVYASAAAAEAGRLRAEWQAASLRKAVEKYTEASDVWRSSGDLRNAALALASVAETHFTRGEYAQSLRLYKRAAGESRRAGDALGELESVNRVGLLTSYLGDNTAALKYLGGALDYYARHGGMGEPPRLTRAHAATLGYVGEVYYSKGALVKASQFLEQALALWVAVGDREGEANARLFSGYIEVNSGERDKAAALFERALALARSLGDRSVEARSLTALGLVHSFKGEEQAALELHVEAGRIFRSLGDGQNEAITLSGLGQVYEDLNEWQTALDNYRQALKLAQVSGSLDLAALSVYKMARAYRSTGDIAQALDYYRQCVALSRAAGKRRMEAYALNDIAAVYDAQGKQQKTLQQYRKILKLYRTVGDRRGLSITLRRIGDLFSTRGDRKGALDFYVRALRPAQESGDRETEVSTLYSIARAELLLGDLEAALAHAEQSIALIEALRTYVASPELRSSYFASVHKHYELYIDVLMRLDRRRPGEGFAAAALQASESARARSLLESLAEANTDIREGVDAALLERERELQKELTLKAQQQRELSSSGDTHGEADEVARDVRGLTAEYQRVQARMREQSPRYNALTQPRPLRLEEIQAAIGDENTILLEYSLGEERSYLWEVTSNSFACHELPARSAVEERAREVYNLLTTRQTAGGETDAEYGTRVAVADGLYRERALDLSRMLLGPVAGRLGGKRLLVVAEGVLQYVPFDALPAPQEGVGVWPDAASPQGVPDNALLVSRHEVVTLPSISALAGMRRERPRESLPDKVVAIVADPVFGKRDSRLRGADDASEGSAPDGSDAVASLAALRAFRDSGDAADIPRLRHAAQEAEAIKAVAPRGGWMLAAGFDANRESATSAEVGQYRIVHFATHSFVNSEHPELSGIILSMLDKDGRQKNGLLQLHDIYDLKLSADLVVLSACDTGLGKDVEGEGIIGLTRGFMYAGSKGVVASLWKVDDRATAELMRHFYGALLRDGMPPAAALRAAKQEMRRQKAFAAPYYWAGFQLQGEFAGSIRVAGGHGQVAVCVLAVLLASAGLFVLFRLLGPSRLK